MKTYTGIFTSRKEMSKMLSGFINITYGIADLIIGLPIILVALWIKLKIDKKWKELEEEDD